MSRSEASVETPSPDVVAAVGRLLTVDPSRTIAVARTLSGPDRTVESTVSGTSMGSGLPPGSRIRIALARRDRFEAGEVVAYVVGSQLVVHRVVHRGRALAARGYLITCGDATLVPDPPVDQGHVLGSVTGVWRGGAWAPLAAPAARTLHARMARGLCASLAVGGLYVSPRATARALRALFRAARAVQASRARRARRRAISPSP